MALVDLNTVLQPAYKNKYAIGVIWNLNHGLSFEE